jgi:hypothetical protein
MKTLAERLKWLRGKRGLRSKKEAALACEIPYGTYQRYEYGGNPSEKHWDKLIGFFKCSRAWLQHGVGVPSPDLPDDLPEKPAVPHTVGESPASYYDKRFASKDNVEQAIGKARIILQSATPYSDALYTNIMQFSDALQLGVALKVCNDTIRDLGGQV